MKRIKGHAHQGMLDPPSIGKTGAATSDEAKTELLKRNTAKMINANDRNLTYFFDMIKMIPPFVYYLMRSNSVWNLYLSLLPRNLV